MNDREDLATASTRERERRYRRLLRVLPAWHREHYEDEMVEVYLAGEPPAAGGRTSTRPAAAEVLATARLAMSSRLRAVGLPTAATLWITVIAASTALTGHLIPAVAMLLDRPI